MHFEWRFVLTQLSDARTRPIQTGLEMSWAHNLFLSQSAQDKPTCVLLRVSALAPTSGAQHCRRHAAPTRKGHSTRVVLARLGQDLDVYPLGTQDCLNGLWGRIRKCRPIRAKLERSDPATCVVAGLSSRTALVAGPRTLNEALF